MKKNIKSFLCFGMLTSISPIIMIPINNSIVHQFNLNTSNDKTENLNNLNQSKINTDFPITTIQKTGHDSKKNVLFFVGEGYAKEDKTKFIDDVKKRANALFTEEPYRFFSNDFNVYAVMPEAKVSGDFSLTGKENNYFGVFKQNGRTASLTKKDKFIKFEKQLTGYLDEGGKILDSIILCNSNDYFGVSDSGISISSLNLGSGENSTIPHEAAHSFAGLSDEYVLDYYSDQEGPNRTKETDPEKVKWKEFFNFRSVGMVQHVIDNYNNSSVPSMFCKMNNTYSKFCEVCKHIIFTIFNKNAKKKEELYIADPFISLEHDWKKEKYYYELGTPQKPIEFAQNKKIDFRTVIHNYRSFPRKIKLKLYFLDQNNNPKKTWEQNFEIKAKELKNIFILTEYIDFFINENDKVFGQVIDLDTGKELANSNTDKETFYDVNIQYKLFENNNVTNNSLENVTESFIKVKKGNNFKIIPPSLSGYQFVKSDIDSDIINDINENKKITLYYRKITASKEITLNFLEKDGSIIQSKKQKIYENEFFKPTDLDFIFNDNNNDNKIKKIAPPNEIVTYADANNKVLNYTYYFSAKPYIEADDIEIKLNSNFNPLDFAEGFSYAGYNLSVKLKVENNNVNTKKPGYYTVTYSITDNEDFLHNYQVIGGTTKKTITVIVLNEDGTLPENNTTPTPPTEPIVPPTEPTNPEPPVTNPNPDENTIEKEIKNEINRINSLNLQLNKEQYTTDEIKKINSTNLFNFLKNWEITPNFIYEIINFSKLNNKINFNIKVQKNSNFQNSKAFNLNYEIKKENIIQQNKTNKISNNEIILFSSIAVLISFLIALSSFIFYKKRR